MTIASHGVLLPLFENRFRVIPHITPVMSQEDIQYFQSQVQKAEVDLLNKTLTVELCLSADPRHFYVVSRVAKDVAPMIVLEYMNGDDALFITLDGSKLIENTVLLDYGKTGFAHHRMRWSFVLIN